MEGVTPNLNVGTLSPNGTVLREALEVISFDEVEIRPCGGKALSSLFSRDRRGL